MTFHSIYDYATPVDFDALAEDEGYKPGQLGHLLRENMDISTADLVLVGCAENRGAGKKNDTSVLDAVRRKLYSLYWWHEVVQVADIGTVHVGRKINDSYAALELVVTELLEAGKKVLVLGGSHDNTLALYRAYAARKTIIEATVVDAVLDIDTEGTLPAQGFLMEMLTGEPNYIKHFNLLGFQSYFTNPSLLEAVDKLRFDCMRVGRVQEHIVEAEPLIRGSQLFSFDVCSMAHAYLPASTLSPNGLTGQEACTLMQYAGLSDTVQLTGIFGLGHMDDKELSAMQLAHMVWYYVDGMQRAHFEAPLTDRSGFIEFHTLCAEVDTVFLQSRHTGRWWMQMPDQSFVPCSYLDYQAASHNELPERWLRIQERY